MRQSIVTKYLGPTNVRRPRVKATAQAGSVTLTWDDAISDDRNHYVAAHALAMRFNWLDGDARLVGGGLPDGSGNCYVFDDEEPAKVRLNDWRDTAIDALIEGRLEVALEIIQAEAITISSGGHIDWRLEPGRVLTANGKPILEFARVGGVGTSGRPFTPHQTDNLAHRIVILLNRHGGGEFMQLGGGRD